MTYQACPTKRAPGQKRRTKAQMEALQETIYETLRHNHPMTVRQLFYQLVGQDAIDKTEAEYDNAVSRLLADMRRAGMVPWEWVVDQTRWMRKPRTYSSLQRMLNNAAVGYRRALWDNQDAYVEIWLEKDALAGILYDVTDEFDVPLMVSKGFSSITYLHDAAMTIQAQEKPAYLYYFGDHDPSGLSITETIENTIREFAPDVDLHFEKVGVLPWQIESWHLPTRPTKKTDTRSKGFEGDSVEVDAIPPQTLRDLARGSIVHHIDHEAWARVQQVEQEERETLQRFTEMLGA